MTIVDTYLAGLDRALPDAQRRELAFATGASREQLDRLRSRYPGCPDSLLELLGRINGTWWQTYGEQRIAVLILGSDVYEYPYYLMSVDQMLDAAKRYDRSIADIYGQACSDDPEFLDRRIDPRVPMGERLCFSQCMNNGGTSILYVDFSPATGGRSGQIVRFLHDPDSYAVIADDFDAYLRQLIDGGYAFVFDEDAI